LEGKEYKRFRFTETGVSPRAALGTKNVLMWYTGDEHNESGHISEEPFNRTLMMEKRMKKLELIDQEVPAEEKMNFYGDKDSENVVISWGSPKGAIIESINILKEEDLSLGFLQLRMLHPLPIEAVKRKIAGRKRIIDIEDNYTGQLGGIIREKTGISPKNYILKYTGRPTSTTEVYHALKIILTEKVPERQVLTFGS
jgi:2-oxoglutarate/2-oxoacid ferredoxin oxidoreductase subunit alpha